MSSKREPLPKSWVNEIFKRLTIRYGTMFVNRYEGIDMELVKADWAQELAGLQHRPWAIKHVLQSLPIEFPPTAGQFRHAASRVSTPVEHVLPAPTTKTSTADSPAKRAALAKLRELSEQWRVSR